MFGIGKRKHVHVTELLSAYLDNQLTGDERSRVEAHLRDCPTCSEDLRSLQATVRALSTLPTVAVPRSFILQPAMQPQRRGSPLPMMLRLATVATAVALVFSIGSDLLLGSSRQAAAPAPSTVLTADATPTPAPAAPVFKAAQEATSGQGVQSTPPAAAMAAPQVAQAPAVAAGVPTAEAQSTITAAGQTALATAPVAPPVPSDRSMKAAPSGAAPLPPTTALPPMAGPGPTLPPPAPTATAPIPTPAPSPTTVPVAAPAGPRLGLHPLQLSLAGLLALLIVASAAINRRAGTR